MTSVLADKYRGKADFRQGSDYVPFTRRSSTTIQPLQFLHGKPWDDVALGYVHGLRPSRVRVVDGGIQLDAQEWRVTVWLKEDSKTIESIDQEVQVGLPEGVRHGADLDSRIK